MHVSTHSTNLNFSVPVTSNPQLHQASVSVLECREQHIAGNCDTEDEIPATVISSVGTINYHQSVQSHQLFVVASGNHHTGAVAAAAAASGSTTAAQPHTAANDHCNAIYAMAATATTTMDGMQQDPANTNLNSINNNNNNNYCNTISNIVITSSSQSSISSAMTATDGIASANPSALTSLNAQTTATGTASHLSDGKDGTMFTSGWRQQQQQQHPSDDVSTTNTSSATNQPRLHPKKRKFNPAEYEEMEPTGGSDAIQHDEKGSQQQQQQLQDCSGNSAFNATNSNNFVQRSNKNWYESGGDASSTATKYSSIIRMAGPSTTHSTMLTATAPAPLTVTAQMVPLASTSQDDTLDLSEWCNHRVLAKQEDIYVAGIIQSVDKNNTILVEFDYPEGTRQTYYNVLGAGRFDVISDASPSAGDLIFGSRVCIRIQSTDRPGNVFVEGAVVDIYNDTKQFLVQIANAIDGNDEYLKVKRGQIRLLRPPWWDELNDCDEFVPNTVVQMTGAAAATTTTTTAMGDNGGAAKQSHCGSNDATGPIYGGANSTMPNSRPANHRLKYITNVEQGTPFQLHHVLPTLQVSVLSLSLSLRDKNFPLSQISFLHFLSQRTAKRRLLSNCLYIAIPSFSQFHFGSDLGRNVQRPSAAAAARDGQSDSRNNRFAASNKFIGDYDVVGAGVFGASASADR